MFESVLQKFTVSEADRIGEGGESSVYMLPEGKMLRVYKMDRKRDFLLALKIFYEGIEGKFSFRTPRILEIAEHDGILYSINEMIPGRAMNDVLPTLTAEQKKVIYQNYFEAMEEIRGVVLASRPYGQILGDDQVTGETWPEFLEKSIRKGAEANSKYLGADIDGFQELIERVVEYARMQTARPEKSFVHGDYFPNNILVGENLEITGVIDVSPLSVVGDYMMDASSSYFFLETTPGAVSEDIKIYRTILFTRYGDSIQKAIDFYRLYYSILFGTKEGPEAEVYPVLYIWSLETLKNFQKTPYNGKN